MLSVLLHVCFEPLLPLLSLLVPRVKEIEKVTGCVQNF